MAEDLSRRHQPVGDLFPLPQSPEAWRALRLTGEQVEFYRENG